MDQNQKLLQELKQFHARHVAFQDAKKELLDRGYSEYDIISTGDAMVYGRYTETKVAASSSPSIDGDSIAASSKEVVLEDLRRRRREAVGIDKDSIIGLFNSKSRHGSIDVLGVPFSKLLIVGVVVVTVLYGLSYVLKVLPEYALKLFIILYLVFICSWITTKIVSINRKIARLEDETKKPKQSWREAVISYAVVAIFVYLVLSFL